jgi:hypothetical protein
MMSIYLFGQPFEPFESLLRAGASAFLFDVELWFPSRETHRAAHEVRHTRKETIRA